MATRLFQFNARLNLFVLLFLSQLLSGTVEAATYFFSDFDNAVVESREEKHGTFKSHYQLYLLPQRANVLQPDLAQLPKVIKVTPREYERIKDSLAKHDNEPGAIGKKYRLESGELIDPGNYIVRNPDSFEYFMEAPTGRNYLLESFKDAETRTTGSYKGQIWKTMALFLSNPETAKNFGLLTARAHSRVEWEQTVDYWIEKNIDGISHRPNFDLFHNVSRSEYEKYGLGGNISAQKIAKLKEFINQLARVPLRPEDARLKPDGKGTEPLHYVVFADDNQETIELAFSLFKGMAQRGTYPIKFGLFNLGNSTEIRQTRRPQFMIIEPAGSFRRATALEQLGELPGMTEEQAKAYLPGPCEVMKTLGEES